MKTLIMIAIVCAIFVLGGCSLNSGNASSRDNTGFKIVNVETSHFDSYTNGKTDTAYVVKGRVSQENDENAIVVFIHAEERATINVRGTLTRIRGNDTEFVYVSEDGERTKITDNSSDSYDVTIDVSKGNGRVIFTGQSAVYDFEVAFELTDGVSYSDL